MIRCDYTTNITSLTGSLQESLNALPPHCVPILCAIRAPNAMQTSRTQKMLLTVVVVGIAVAVVVVVDHLASPAYVDVADS